MVRLVHIHVAFACVDFFKILLETEPFNWIQLSFFIPLSSQEIRTFTNLNTFDWWINIGTVSENSIIAVCGWSWRRFWGESTSPQSSIVSTVMSVTGARWRGCLIVAFSNGLVGVLRCRLRSSFMSLCIVFYDPVPVFSRFKMCVFAYVCLRVVKCFYFCVSVSSCVFVYVFVYVLVRMFACVFARGVCVVVPLFASTPVLVKEAFYPMLKWTSFWLDSHQISLPFHAQFLPSSLSLCSFARLRHPAKYRVSTRKSLCINCEVARSCFLYLPVRSPSMGFLSLPAPKHNLNISVKRSAA